MTAITKLTTSLIFLDLLAALPLAAQGSGEEAPAFDEVVDVRMINLEVVVTRKGERVEGLASDDFRLLVDGQEVPIEYFTEVREGRATTGDATGSDALTVPAVAPGEAVGTRYLVFIDDYFSIPTHRNRVLRELSEQLTLMEPEDRMAIVAFDGTQVEMLSSWTRSLMQLESALDQARARRAYGLQRRSEQRRLDTLARFDRRSLGGFANLYLYRRGYYDYEGYDFVRSQEIDWQVSRVVQGAASALRAFARPPGRKVMLLLSGGWPAASLDYAVGGFGPITGYDGWRAFDPLVVTANRLGYTLYPVDVDRDPGAVHGSTEYGSLFDAAVAAEISDERDRLGEDTLFYLADRTGGRAFVDGGALKALERTVEDTRTYYWLGFAPAWEENDRRHRVKVEMRTRGLKVRARESFSDLSRQSEMSMMVESAQMFDLPVPGQGGLEVSFGEPSKAGYKKVVVPVRLEIPLDQVTVLPVADGFAARLELRVAATDSSGATAEIPILPVEMRSANAPESGAVGVWSTQLRLRSKPHKLLLSLYDPSSGNVLSQRVDLSL